MRRTRRLMVVRHGGHDGAGELSRDGVKQMEGISKKICSRVVHGESVIILSSTSKRAMQSAQYIADALGIGGYRACDVLLSNNNHPANFPKALELVESFMDDYDIIIMVTHYEYAERFPHYFGRKVLNSFVSSYHIGNGCMWDLKWHQVPQSYQAPRLDLVFSHPTY